MKKMAYAGLAAAALALTALSGQKAGAQCCPQPCQRGGEVSFNIGLTLGAHWTPCQGHKVWVPNCPPPGCIGPYGPPPYGYPPPPYGYPPPPGAAGAAGAAGAPNAPKDPKDTKEQNAAAGVQNVGYSYPAAYGYDNSYPYYGYGYGYGYPYYGYGYYGYYGYGQ